MTCGLKELLLNGQSQEAAVSLFPRLFSCITLRLGASVGVSIAKSNNKHAPSVHVAGLEYPICYSDEKFQSTNMFLVDWFSIGFQYFRVAADALQILLARAQLDEVLKRLDEDKAWDSMKEANTHITGVTLLAR